MPDIILGTTDINRREIRRSPASERERYVFTVSGSSWAKQDGLPEGARALESEVLSLLDRRFRVCRTRLTMPFLSRD